MRVSPALAALRADPAPIVAGHARAAAGLAQWRAAPPGAALASELGRFGAGEPLDRIDLLAGLFAGDGGGALPVLLDLIAGSIATMRTEPLSPVPWRHFTNGVLHSVSLLTAGRASLSLMLIDGPAWRAARHGPEGELVAFQPGELHVRVVAGRGHARIVRNRSADPVRAILEAERLELCAGAVYALDGTREALAFDTLEGGLVALRLRRATSAPSPARQYELATGHLVHQAAGTAQASRAEMIMALLRAMDRDDAAPTLAALTREGETAARWQALRECLALDAATGLRELARIAADATDPLTVPARALLDDLAARDAAFAQALEDVLCPA